MRLYYTNMTEKEVEKSEMLDGIDIHESLSEIWTFADYKKSQPNQEAPLYGHYMSWLNDKEDEHEDLACLNTRDGSMLYFFVPDDLSVMCWLDENDHIVRRRWEDER